MLKKICLLSIILAFGRISHAQKLTEFSKDSVKFIKELNEYFYDFSANKKDAENYISDFQKVRCV